MANDLAKFELESAVRMLLIRHRGNVNKVKDDYFKERGGKLTDKYIGKVLKKLKREISTDKSKWIGYHFAQELIANFTNIQAKLEKQLDSYGGLGVRAVSLCCDAPVDVDHLNPSDDSYVCMKCDQPCKIDVKVNRTVEKLKLDTIEKMQEQNEFTVKFLQSMGALAGPSGGGVIVNNCLMGDGQSNTKMVDSRVTQIPDNLDPNDKERLDGMSPLDQHRLLEDYKKGKESGGE